jgi:hypothetical protein
LPAVYFYKLTVDAGGAPCVAAGLLSLAICKPMIRTSAKEEDVIIGFAADSLHADNRLIYVARVTKKLTDREYFKQPKYAACDDCIYEWRCSRFVVRAGAKFHGTLADLVHDLGKHPTYSRANTLLSREFCYFGESGSDAYKRAFPAVARAVGRLGRGHRVHHDTKLLDSLERLVKWSGALDGASIRGKPTNRPRCGVSHRGGGSCVVVRKGLC